MNIHPVGAESFHADQRKNSRTDRQDKSISRFSQFCESNK